MPRAKISEFSTTAGDNTDIDGINIAEGCAPSGINDAIRELMAQLKDFQSGAAGDNITVVGTLLPLSLLTSNGRFLAQMARRTRFSPQTALEC